MRRGVRRQLLIVRMKSEDALCIEDEATIPTWGGYGVDLCFGTVEGPVLRAGTMGETLLLHLA